MHVEPANGLVDSQSSFPVYFGVEQEIGKELGEISKDGTTNQQTLNLVLGQAIGVPEAAAAFFCM